MSEKSFICLWLEAPLQSWGVNSKFYRKNTLNFPSKSAICGLLLSAMGRKGKQFDLLSKFADLDMQVLACSLNESLEILEDFQMIGAAYNQACPWQKLLIPKKGNGLSPTGVSGSKLTYRYYLQDSAFAVALEVPFEMKDEIIQALQFPIYDIYLGRKSCVPTDFVYKGNFSSMQDSLVNLSNIISSKGYSHRFTVKQGRHDDEAMDMDIFSIDDQPIQFGAEKRYGQRVVSIIHV